MRSHYDFIYLSPHLDDAALSCGGQIFAQTTAGHSILIVTIMAGDPPTKPLTEFVHSLHARWELPKDATSRRRAEDISACRALGADYLHWEIPDCVYRVHPTMGAPLYVDEASIFGEVHPAESNLIDKLARQIASLPGCNRLLVPLTVGHHVDHQITRLAAERSLVTERACFYEEYPYASETGALNQFVLGAPDRWRAQVIPLKPADLQAKIESVAMFESQLSTFFADRDDLAKQVSEYVQRVGGERLWCHVPFPSDE